jgi:hypothetical protein
MPVRKIAASWFFVFVSLAVAQQTPYKADEKWAQVCDKVQKQPLESPAFSKPLPPDELEECDETELYYGFGDAPDYDAALQCGWYQRAHPQDQVANMFYGPGVLTMLYANGQGVPRNYDLAIRFACEQGWAAKAEQALRIGHLEYLRDSGSQATKFDLCDDITSGRNQTTCAGIESRATDTKRAAKLAAITRSFAPAAQALFPALQKAEEAFEQSRIETEIDLSGTARGALQFDDETKLREQFLINLERFGRGDIPPASASDLATLDRQLNIVYQQIQHAPPETWKFGTVKPQGIRTTQRRWLELAQAWANFAPAAYPNLSAERIRAQLIRLRLHQLRALLPESK